ncbi:HEAT repeat domain-containing protein [Gordonia sp. SID5947]|uniref:HEAT repeat domain-containing protein n=1 Tax=Gordonia sp. SID5947 TaxID=2690315 RepID=UPI001370FC97|nr:HEAT repeat domain-containing protein [Gordonia sp. SID5947]MYR08046.1 HEAT repeat domain-containing protein [Gordonia sp. SID5947]
MNNAIRDTRQNRLVEALSGPQPSTRLQAALAAGTYPDDTLVGALVERCGVEPDFFVRDMLTWALTRCSVTVTIPRLLAELTSPTPQARGQALHTLSKIGDRTVWSNVPSELLHDSDDDVARSAWRAAVVLVPDGERGSLAAGLAAEFGRGDEETRRSLSRALVALGESAVPLVVAARAVDDDAARDHAIATARLMDDPDSDFAAAVDHARRVLSLKDAPSAGTDADR